MSKGIVAKFVRLLRGRAILWASIAVAIAAYSVIPQHHRFPSRLLLAWDIGTFFYLVIVAVTLYRSTVTDIRRHAPIYDEGRFGILVLVLVAVTASFVAIVMELASARANGKTDALALILAGATVVLSWTFTHVMFAVHYAHEFYGKHETGERRGLEFPENRRTRLPRLPLFRIRHRLRYCDGRRQHYEPPHPKNRARARRFVVCIQYRHPRAHDQHRGRPHPKLTASPGSRTVSPTYRHSPR